MNREYVARPYHGNGRDSYSYGHTGPMEKAEPRVWLSAIGAGAVDQCRDIATLVLLGAVFS
jgi:hypothetical protein